MLQIHKALCEAEDNSELFGGINIIFVGDFAQLPPVGDTRLYSHLQKETVCKGRGKGLGTKSIIRMPIFDGASYPIYYTKAVLGLRARAQGIS